MRTWLCAAALLILPARLLADRHARVRFRDDYANLREVRERPGWLTTLTTAHGRPVYGAALEASLQAVDRVTELTGLAHRRPPCSSASPACFVVATAAVGLDRNPDRDDRRRRHVAAGSASRRRLGHRVAGRARVGRSARGLCARGAGLANRASRACTRCGGSVSTRSQAPRIRRARSSPSRRSWRSCCCGKARRRGAMRCGSRRTSGSCSSPSSRVPSRRAR